LATVTVNALSGDSAVVVDSVQYIKKGQVIDIYESSSEVVDSKTVLSVDSATLTVTFTATLGAGVTAANSPKVKRHLAHNKEIQGLKLIVAQGTYILVPATVPEWTANLVTLPGSYTDAQILEYIQKAYTASEKADEPPTFAITTYELRDKYANTLTTLRRIVDTMDLKFGFKALKFNDVGIAADDQAPEGFFAWINTKKLVMNHVTDFDWADEDGKILDKVPGYDAYRAYMVYAGNLAASRRNSHTLLNGW
jgi:hypothetical protein